MIRRIAIITTLSICALSVGALVFAPYASGQAAEISGEWTRGAPMPTPRSEAAAAALDGRLYVASGLALNRAGNGWRALDNFEVYDPETDTWEILAPLPVGLHHTAMAAADGRLFVAGGYDAADFTADVRAVWAFDPAVGTWEQLGDMPGARAAHALVALDEWLYLVGGVGEDANALWRYDPKTDTWDTSAAPLPTAREHLAAAALDGKLYVISGRWGSSGNLYTLEVYDPQTDTWDSLAEMITPTSGFTAGVIDGHIHVTGGEALRLDATLDQHEVYDPAADRWTALPDAPLSRHGHASAVIDGRWYVVGGSTLAAGRTFTSLSAALLIFSLSE